MTTNTTTSNHVHSTTQDPTAASRRITRLSDRVTERLTDELPQENLLEFVIESLYYESDAVRFDDLFELVHLVDEPSADLPIEDAIQSLVADAHNHLQEWGRFETAPNDGRGNAPTHA